MGLDAGGAGCCRGRKMIEVGSEPLDRLLVKMAVARGVSGRRGGRLPPWPEVRRGGREPDERPSATVAGGPSFVPASVVGGHGIVERARNGQRAFGPSVDHRLAGLAAARVVSERRGSRLSPRPERVTSRWVFRRASVGEVAGGPRFVRASWSWHCRKGPERAAMPGAVSGLSGNTEPRSIHDWPLKMTGR